MFVKSDRMIVIFHLFSFLFHFYVLSVSIKQTGPEKKVLVALLKTKQREKKTHIYTPNVHNKQKSR